MEEILIKLAGQIPSLLVLVFLTVKFLAHLKEISTGYADSIDRIQNRNEKAFDDLHNEHKKTQYKSIDAMNGVENNIIQNNMLIKENIEIHKKVLAVLERK